MISAVLQAAGKEAVNEGTGKPKAVSALFQPLLLGVVAPLGYLYLSVSCGQLLGHVLFQQTLESRYSMSNMAPWRVNPQDQYLYRLAEMSPLICFSLVPYARQGHGLGKRPCKLSSLLFSLKLACRSAKAQALCQCQICHLMMKKRTSRLAGPLERTLSAGFTGKVSLARCASVLLLGKTPVCPTVSFLCYFCVARTGTKGRDLRRVLTGMLWQEESWDKVLCIYWKQEGLFGLGLDYPRLFRCWPWR